MDITKADIKKADIGTLIAMWTMWEFFNSREIQDEWGKPFPVVNNEKDFFDLLFAWQKFMSRKSELLNFYKHLD